MIDSIFLPTKPAWVGGLVGRWGWVVFGGGRWVARWEGAWSDGCVGWCVRFEDPNEGGFTQPFFLGKYFVKDKSSS